MMRLNRQNVYLIIAALFIPLAYISFSTFLKFRGIDYPTRLLYTRLFCWVEVGALFLYARFIEKKSFLIWEQQSYGLRFFISSVLILTLLCFVSSIITAIFSKIFHENFDQAINVIRIILSKIWLAPLTIVTAGFTEELIFRGFLIPRFESLFNSKHLAVIASALIFSFLHIGYHTYFHLLFTFGLGVLMGLFYEKYKNIHILICVHLLYDAVAIYSRS
jgi:membrane protease YdiL (CAAX protease family)